MLEADKPEFLGALCELALLKPGANLTEDTYEAWWNAMREKWTLAAFRQACVKLRDTVEFMPNPFHFEQLRKRMHETCGEAWARAREHARTLPMHGGFLQEVPSGDELLDRVARCVGGYRAIAAVDARDANFLERRFCQHYEDIATAVDTRDALPQLAAETRKKISGPQPVANLLAIEAPK